MFLRRALLGWPKTRKSPPDQREGDFDEVFDEAYHTTGFSRPYEFACDGGEICDRVQTVFTQCRPDALDTLQRLWADLTTNIIRYVSNGVVDDDLEVKMAEDCKLINYARGVVEPGTLSMLQCDCIRIRKLTCCSSARVYVSSVCDRLYRRADLALGSCGTSWLASQSFDRSVYVGFSFG